MSAAIVRQALEIVDSDGKSLVSKKKAKKGAFAIVPKNQRTTKRHKRGKTSEQIGLPTKQKYTISEAKVNHKSKEEVLKENLKKLELIRKYCSVDLDKDLTKQIIERAVTRRPIKTKTKSKKEKKTVFTEEDFKKFEEEYFAE